jgi:hypothetical protein
MLAHGVCERTLEHGVDVRHARARLRVQEIGSCIASIYEPERARQILGVPDEHAFDIALSLGYPDLAAARSAAPPGQGHKSFDGVVRFERW